MAPVPSMDFRIVQILGVGYFVDPQIIGGLVVYAEESDHTLVIDGIVVIDVFRRKRFLGRRRVQIGEIIVIS